MKRLTALSLLVLAPSVSSPASASGYYSGGKGARAAGRAGAFGVKADDLSAVSLNPAGLARIDGTLLHVGNRFSHNALSFTREPTLDYGNLEMGVPPLVPFAPSENGTPWQLLDPLLGVASNLGLDGWGFALSIIAPPGVARQEFSLDGGQRYLMVEREAILLDIAASAGYRVSDDFALGASLVWRSAPRIDYALVIDAVPFPGDANPVSSELDLLARTRGSDAFVPGMVLGAWYRPTRFLELGASATFWLADIETESRLSIDALSPEIDDEVVLRRDAEFADDVSLSLPLALSARLGMRYIQHDGARELFDVELDIVYETWSRVDRFTLDSRGLQASLLSQRIDIEQIQIEKQWRDTWGVQVGGDVNVLDGVLTARGGLLFESAVAERGYAHVDFPSGQQWGGALGASLFVSGVELAVAYDFRLQSRIQVSEDDARVYQEVPSSSCAAPYTDPDLCHPEYLGQPSPAVNAGSHEAQSHVASLDVIYRF